MFGLPPIESPKLGVKRGDVVRVTMDDWTNLFIATDVRESDGRYSVDLLADPFPEL